jgi:hypothetical protein
MLVENVCLSRRVTPTSVTQSRGWLSHINPFLSDSALKRHALRHADLTPSSESESARLKDEIVNVPTCIKEKAGTVTVLSDSLRHLPRLLAIQFVDPVPTALLQELTAI